MKRQICWLGAVLALGFLTRAVHAEETLPPAAPPATLLAPPARVEITPVAPAPPVVKARSRTARVIDGSLAIETPLGSPDRPADRSPMLLGRLNLPRLLGPVGVFVGGQWQTRSGSPYNRENKFLLGLEIPVGAHLTAYTFGERRFGTGDNRIVAGLRWNFSGNY